MSWKINKLAILVGLTLLAWLPSLRRYTPHHDDLIVLATGSHLDYFHHWGLWRIVGHSPTILLNYYPFTLLAILGHLIASILFYLCARKFVGDRAFFISLIFALFPFGSQAIVWASAFSYVLCAVFFWAAILKREAFWICFVCSLLCAFSNEGLLIALFVSGVLFRTIAPSLATAVYAVAHKLAATGKPITSINLESLVSVWAYQYYPVVRVVNMWGRWWPILMLLVGSLVVSLYYSERITVEKRSALLFLILMLAASSVYVLAGGFSLDSRKEYVLLPLLLMFLGSLLPVKPSRYALISLILIGIASTWIFLLSGIAEPIG